MAEQLLHIFIQTTCCRQPIAQHPPHERGALGIPLEEVQLLDGM
jgi:hypothetical protein